MTSKIILSIFSFICTLQFVQAQLDSLIEVQLNKLKYAPENLNPKFDSIRLETDSIKIVVKYNRNQISAENFFIHSNRLLTVKYYFSDDSLRFITTSEICQIKPELECFSEYYILANRINQETHGSRKENKYHIAYKVEEIIEAHYCPTRFDYRFLEKYVFQLLSRIASAVRA